MRKTIGVVGLTSNENIGDYLLVESTKYLIRTHDPDINLIDIDVDPRDEQVYSGKRRLNLKLFEILTRIEGPMLAILRTPRLAYHYRYFCWWIKLNWYYSDRINGVDAIIFAGGGFLKYKTQGLNYLDELILNTTSKRDIPVMFNAVGVEGYSETDIRSQSLKRKLNASNVKVITTRDDIDTLRDHYIHNKNIVTERVGDPVFWLRDMRITDIDTPRKRSGNKIGVNLINPNNFSAYGGKISRFAVINFYKNLITELKRRNADFYLFSNGMEVDQRFGSNLVVSMNLRKDQLIHAPETSDEFVNLVANFDIILSARMHAGITAYALDVPVVGLIWGEKLQFLTKITGLRDRYFNEDELDYKKIADMLVKNNLQPPDKKLRSKLRSSTVAHLTSFIDSIYGEKND